MPDKLGDIDTLVVLMMQSRSFDHVLGHLSLDGGPYEGRLDGLVGTPIDGKLLDARYENTCEGRIHQPQELRDGAMPGDLPEDSQSVQISLGRRASSGKRCMDGFVRAYALSTHRASRSLPMGFLRSSGAPITNFLAKSYAICDRWFAPLPTGVAPNRLMATCGYSLLADTTPRLLPLHDTVFDWMKQRGVRYRVYHDGLSFFTLGPWMHGEVTSERFRPAARLEDDVRNESDATFPQVIYIEPSYFDAPFHLGRPPNDNRPPLPMAPGERFLLQVYQALTSNPKRFGRTLFIVTYASHGGLYDHVSPPSIHDGKFATTGVRVPAIVVSPLVEPGTVHSGLLDHTSILQLLAEKFGDGAYSEAVTHRATQGIGSVSAVLNRGAARSSLPVPPSPPERPGPKCKRSLTPLTNGAQAFDLAARALCDHAPARVASAYPELWQAMWNAELQ
ncbi:MAG TPA: alkaline phosphatase family protein [Polyangium sp.]|nr:alkaline phosphatase family protein [Polyangium sp.]